jgi:hypothetical protein
MTIVTPTGITGINSITSLVNDITFSTASGGSLTANGLSFTSINGGPISGARNRIINGDMRIDQRRNGASLLISSTGTYTVDRFAAFAIGGGAITVQQSTTAPPGFSNSLQNTVTTVDSSLAATDEYGIYHNIEGFNVADLDFGTANAKTVTVSFWVRSSIIGTYGFSFKNSGSSRTYPTSYSISAANTWEYKTITIPGDTTGTWLKSNGVGIEVHFCLGAGSSRLGTANAWVSANNGGATGSTAWISNAGATFFLTGVQLEAGTVATPFERRSFGQELALCQRYFQKSYSQDQAPGAVNSEENAAIVIATSTTRASVFIKFFVEMRTDPTMTAYGTTGSVGGIANINSLSNVVTSVTFASNHYSPTGVQELNTAGGLTGGNHYQLHWTASAEL